MSAPCTEVPGTSRVGTLGLQAGEDVRSLIDFSARQYKEGQLSGEQVVQQRLRHVLGLNS